MRCWGVAIVAGAAIATIAAPAASAATRAGASAAPTGALLVLLRGGRSAAVARAAAIARLGARPAGKSVPEIGLITVRPAVGMTAAALARRLRALPGVASVEPERRYVPRALPDDPALTAIDPASGQPWQWYLLREDFPRAWSITNGAHAVVGVIDSGIDATHPDLSSKLAMPPRDQQVSSTGPADTDQIGHGTHIASLACAATGNGIGMAGAGDDCRLVIEKTDFSDSSIAAAIVDAANQHVDALNMSFGPDPDEAFMPAPASEVKALHYALGHKVVLVAAAADAPTSEQGDPANVLQPAGTAADLEKGLGIDVTAAQSGGARAAFAGFGGEISMAAYGSFAAPSQQTGSCMGAPLGVFGAFPGNPTQLEEPPDPAACRVTFGGDPRYATIAGTSMATPQVTATAAMMRALNPYASAQDVIETLKRTAQRPRDTGWNSNLGWGILDAGAALAAIRRLDALPPVSRLTAPRITSSSVLVLRWSGHDVRQRGLATSGIAYYDVYVRFDGGRPRRVARTQTHSLKLHLLPGPYVFYTVAVDRAGNREVKPVQVSTRMTG